MGCGSSSGEDYYEKPKKREKPRRGSVKLDDDKLKAVYVWIDQLPLSRSSQNITEDFADGCLLAEILHLHYPSEVELKYFKPAVMEKQRHRNFVLLDELILQTGIPISEKEINGIVNDEAGVAEVVLYNLMKFLKSQVSRIEKDLSRKLSHGSNRSQSQELGGNLTEGLQLQQESVRSRTSSRDGSESARSLRSSEVDRGIGVDGKRSSRNALPTLDRIESGKEVILDASFDSYFMANNTSQRSRMKDDGASSDSGSEKSRRFRKTRSVNEDTGCNYALDFQKDRLSSSNVRSQNKEIDPIDLVKKRFSSNTPRSIDNSEINSGVEFRSVRSDPLQHRSCNSNVPTELASSLSAPSHLGVQQDVYEQLRDLREQMVLLTMENKSLGQMLKVKDAKIMSLENKIIRTESREV